MRTTQRRRPNPRAARAALAVSIAVCASVWPASAAAQTLRTDLPATGFVHQTQDISLTADRPLAETQRVAVFIDDLDVTALFRAAGGAWLYAGAEVPLSAGTHELVAWIVDGDTLWTEVLRQPFRVAGALTLERAGLRRGVDVGLRSRIASAFVPAPAPERTAFNDVDGQLSLDGEIVHHGGAVAALRAQVSGTSERQRALRAAQLQEDAPYIDLASYAARVARGPVELTLGNVSVGGARHLISGFASRGATLALNGGPRVQLTAAAMHGSNVVGWDDLTGLGEPDHRILTASVGVEALRQPGALRLDITALDGSILPRAGFDRGAVTDRETSSGVALRLQSQLLQRRVRMDAGLTRSAFDNPPDLLLARESALVPVERDARGAYFAQLSADLLRGVPIGGGRTARLTVGWAAERVDPLFRTVGGYARADQMESRWELRADVAQIAIGGNVSRARNNLDDVASILTSETQRAGFDVAVPVAQIVGGPAWLPQLRWRTDRTHQFGRGVPPNSGFAPGHVPDQVTTIHSAGVDTRAGPIALGYRLDLSAQDNRQEGRDNADFENGAHALSFAATVLRTLSMTLDLSRLTARTVERDELDRTRRAGLTLNWRPRPDANLALQLSDTRGENDGTGAVREERSWSAQWSAPAPGLSTVGGRWLLRFARADHAATGFGDVAIRRESWMVEAGFNLNLR